MAEAEALLTAVRTLTSDNGYKAIVSLTEEIPPLKRQIESKTKEADGLRAEIVSLKARHQERLQEDLELYRAQHNKVEGENSELSGNISTLERTIREKDRAIAELSRTVKNLQSQLEQSRKSLDKEREKVTTANGEITKLQQGQKDKDIDIEKLKEALRKEQIKVSSAEGKSQDAQTETDSLRQKLKLTTARLSEIEGYTTELREQGEEVWVRKIAALWGSARRLVESYFKKDLPEESLEDVGAWKNLRDSQFLNRSIPLPQSNSLAAKRMRIAALLAILARCIDMYIFQPVYFEDADNVIRQLLVRLAVENSRKESFFRSLLLSTFTQEQAKHSANGVKQVVREVGWYVQELLSGADLEDFRSGLEQIAQQAREVWHIVQHARERFEPNFDLSSLEDVEWEALRFEGEAGTKEPSLTGTSEGDQELLVIFPPIFLLEDAPPYPITNGVALMKSQARAAVEEVERKNSSSPSVGKTGPRHKPTRSRTKSISLNGGKEL